MTDQEMEFVNEEGINYLPSSRASAHEANNPFKAGETKGQSNLTPRCTLLPTKPRELYDIMKYSRSNRTGIIEKVTTKERNASGYIGFVKVEGDGLLNSYKTIVASKAKNRKRIQPYQTKTNAELKKQFNKLAHFKGIDKSWLIGCKVNLRPQTTHKKTLILDLDGTLICNSYRATYKSDSPSLQPEVISMSPTNNDDEKIGISFHIRPHVMKLLRTLKFFYEIIVFTAANESYAKPIIEYLDPKKCCIAYLLHRKQCVMNKNWIVKDLRVIGRRELKNMIIIDNSVICFAENLDNGIYVPTFEGDPNDRELLPIINFLKEIHDVDDVRPYVREFAGIQKLFFEHNC